jgi:D-citramalate synthase
LDTTLRDGEQTPGVALTTEKKLLIARALDEMKISVIEAGSAITSSGERESIKAIANAGLDAEICSYCRLVKSDVDRALECDVDSIHLVAPVSDLHIKTKIKKGRDAVRQIATEVIEYARDHGLVVELSGEDSSRADLEFLKAFFSDGLDVGAERLCFCDTVGLLVPEKATAIFKDLSSSLKAPISIHCHNDFGLATANTVAALAAGAKQAHVTVNGLGERAGNASLEEVVMSLEWLYKYDTGISHELIYKTSRLVSRLTGIPVSPNKALVGGNAFTHEAGIHVHGLLADKATYEPMSPEYIGRQRQIVLGKHAGRSSVTLALKEMGLEADEAQIEEIFNRVKQMGDKGKHVTDADLQTVAENVLDIYREPLVKLEEFTIVSGNKVTPTASIKLRVKEREIVQAGIGNGPVDAAINAIRRAVSSCAEDIVLEEYHVDSITGGTDALVEVRVKLSKEGKVITASGARTDIIMASVEAVMNGMNRLIRAD